MPTFTAMTWNVENLFAPGHRISPARAVSEAEYEAKLDYLAERILEVRPDVVALQEIGGESTADTRPLNDLQGRLQGVYSHAASSQFLDGRGIRVAFLSSLPIARMDETVDFPPGELAEVPDWDDEPPIRRMGRGALGIEVEFAGERIRLLTAHLKSKLISYPSETGTSRFTPRDENERARGAGLALVRRAAEALTVRTRVNVWLDDGGAHTIVLGDLNDVPRAATTQMLLGPEDADVTSPDRLDPVRLYNLMDGIPMRGDERNDRWFLPETERHTRTYVGRREILDQILVSRSLLGETGDLSQGRWRVLEVRSMVDSIEAESIGNLPSERIGRPRPDHAPVYARFDI